MRMRHSHYHVGPCGCTSSTSTKTRLFLRTWRNWRCDPVGTSSAAWSVCDLGGAAACYSGRLGQQALEPGCSTHSRDGPSTVQDPRGSRANECRPFCPGPPRFACASSSPPTSPSPPRSSTCRPHSSSPATCSTAVRRPPKPSHTFAHLRPPSPTVSTALTASNRLRPAIPTLLYGDPLVLPRMSVTGVGVAVGLALGLRRAGSADPAPFVSPQRSAWRCWWSGSRSTATSSPCWSRSAPSSARGELPSYRPFTGARSVHAMCHGMCTACARLHA